MGRRVTKGELVTNRNGKGWNRPPAQQPGVGSQLLAGATPTAVVRSYLHSLYPAILGTRAPNSHPAPADVQRCYAQPCGQGPVRCQCDRRGDAERPWNLLRRHAERAAPRRFASLVAGRRPAARRPPPPVLLSVRSRSATRSARAAGDLVVLAHLISRRWPGSAASRPPSTWRGPHDVPPPRRSHGRPPSRLRRRAARARWRA